MQSQGKATFVYCLEVIHRDRYTKHGLFFQDPSLPTCAPYSALVHSVLPNNFLDLRWPLMISRIDLAKRFFQSTVYRAWPFRHLGCCKQSIWADSCWISLICPISFQKLTIGSTLEEHFLSYSSHGHQTLKLADPCSCLKWRKGFVGQLIRLKKVFYSCLERLASQLATELKRIWYWALPPAQGKRKRNREIQIFTTTTTNREDKGVVHYSIRYWKTFLSCSYLCTIVGTLFFKQLYKNNQAGPGCSSVETFIARFNFQMHTKARAWRKLDRI